MQRTGSAITPRFYLLLAETNRLFLQASKKTQKVWKVYSMVFSWFNCGRPWVTAALPNARLLTENPQRGFCPVVVLSDALGELGRLNIRRLGELRQHLGLLQELEINGDKQLTFLTRPQGSCLNWKTHLKDSAAHLKDSRSIMRLYMDRDEDLLTPLDTLEQRLKEALALHSRNRALKHLWRTLQPDVFIAPNKLAECGADPLCIQFLKGPIYRVWHEMLNLTALSVTEHRKPEEILSLLKPVQTELGKKPSPFQLRSKKLLKCALKPLRRKRPTPMQKARVFQVLLAIDIRSLDEEEPALRELTAPVIEKLEKPPPPPWTLAAKSCIQQAAKIDCFLAPRRGFQLCQVERNITLEAASCWLGTINADPQTALQAALGALLNAEHAWLAHCGLLPQNSPFRRATLHPDDHLPKNLEVLLHTCHAIAEEAEFENFATIQPLLSLNGSKPKQTDDPVGTILKTISLLLKQIQQPL